MEILEIVKKLIGPIVPIGDSNIDRERLENLKVIINLTDALLAEIGAIEMANRDKVENSMKLASKLCANFFTQLGIED